jgi:hypothetical protein
MLPEMLYDLVFYLNLHFRISNQLVVVTIIIVNPKIIKAGLN